MNDTNLLTTILSSITNHPQDISIEKTTDDMGVLLVVRVNPADMGKVIGREGNTINAIRTIMKSFGMMHTSRINVKIEDLKA